ncbi:MAG TPA: hypothetical protein VEI97_14810 [bacterium]|nr:hypothetical protein [bacterium]
MTLSFTVALGIALVLLVVLLWLRLSPAHEAGQQESDAGANSILTASSPLARSPVMRRSLGRRPREPDQPEPCAAG